jgi:hypothetical protein
LDWFDSIFLTDILLWGLSLDYLVFLIDILLWVSSLVYLDDSTVTVIFATDILVFLVYLFDCNIKVTVLWQRSLFVLGLAWSFSTK